MINLNGRKPCSRCGSCCKSAVCEVAEALGLQTIAPCSVLENTNGLYCCGLIVNPVKCFPKSVDLPDHKKIWLSKYLEAIMGFGIGCTNEDKYLKESP